MNPTPPEPGAGAHQGMGITPEEFIRQQGEFDKQHPRPRMSPRRIICGVLWGAITLILAVGGVLELTVHIPGGAVLCFVLAVGTGWYDYRVWTRKTSRLLMII
jgi:hypothetical protein